jgi:hypothetical protein
MNQLTHVAPFLLMLVPLMAQDPSATRAPGRAVKLNGGLEAEVISIGRSKDHRSLTISVLLSNKGKNAAYLLLAGTPIVNDNTGTTFNLLDQVGGLAYCPKSANTRWTPSTCVGLGGDTGPTTPIQGFTQLDPNPDPNAGITINFYFRIIGGGESTGPMVSLSADILCRFVTDPVKDATLTDKEQYRQFRLMTLSVPAVPVTDAK